MEKLIVGFFIINDTENSKVWKQHMNQILVSIAEYKKEKKEITF